MTKYISFLYIQKNYRNDFNKSASNAEIKIKFICQLSYLLFKDNDISLNV